jgi:transposase
MLTPTGWYMATAPVDLRCGMDRLLGVVQQLGRDATDGGAYAFRNRAGSRMKVLCVDAHGVWLCVRRLHRGGLVWPNSAAVVVSVSAEQMAWLSQGLDWVRMSARLSDVGRLL